MVTEAMTTYSQSILQICRVGHNDEVQYTCSANNSFGTDRASFNLTVNRMCSLYIVVIHGVRGGDATYSGNSQCLVAFIQEVHMISSCMSPFW